MYSMSKKKKTIRGDFALLQRKVVTPQSEILTYWSYLISILTIYCNTKWVLKLYSLSGIFFTNKNVNKLYKSVILTLIGVNFPLVLNCGNTNQS